MIETLWRQHYHAGVTGSYHGDMARAFSAMLEDSWCDSVTKAKLTHAINLHCQLERSSVYQGRKWFCESFGTSKERIERSREVKVGGE